MVQVNVALQFEASLAQHQDQLLRYGVHDFLQSMFHFLQGASLTMNFCGSSLGRTVNLKPRE